MRGVSPLVLRLVPGASWAQSWDMKERELMALSRQVAKLAERELASGLKTKLEGVLARVVYRHQFKGRILSPTVSYDFEERVPELTYRCMSSKTRINSTREACGSAGGRIPKSQLRHSSWQKGWLSIRSARGAPCVVNNRSRQPPPRRSSRRSTAALAPF